MDRFVGAVSAVGLLLLMFLGVTAIVRTLAWRDDVPHQRVRDRNHRPRDS